MRRFSPIFSTLLISLLTVLGFASPVLAAPNGSLSFAPDKTTLTVGDEVRVTVNATANEFSAGSVDFSITFDATKLDYQSEDASGTSFPNSIFQPSASGEVRVIRGSVPGGAAGTKKVSTYIFKSKAAGATTLRFTNAKMFNTNGQSQPVSTGTATLTINTVQPPSAPTISTFTVSPTAIKKGQSATLKWEVSNASSISINQGVGTVSASGEKSVSPSVTTLYTLTATNSGGVSTKLISLQVSDLSPPNIKSFSADPSKITRGNRSTLRWEIENAKSVSIDQGVGSVGTAGDKSVAPTAKTTYILSASNDDGSTTRSVTIDVEDPTATPPPATPTPKPTAKPTTKPTTVASTPKPPTAAPAPAPAPSADPNAISASQSTVTFSDTTAVADGVDSIVVTVQVRKNSGTVVTDVEPVLTGLRDIGDAASPFVFNEIDQTWETQLTSTEVGLVSTVITASDVVLLSQDISFTEPEVTPAPVETTESGSSFVTMILIGLGLLLLLLLLLFFLWRKLHHHDDEDEELEDDGQGPAFPGEGDDQGGAAIEETPSEVQEEPKAPEPKAEPPAEAPKETASFDANQALQRQTPPPAETPAQTDQTIPL